MFTPTGPHLCHALAARQNARHLSRLYDSHLAPAGLSVSQFSILSLLEAYGSLKITKLAEMLGMERTTLVRALKPLQTAGWVEAGRADSSRSLDVALSPSGLDKVAQAAPLWENAQNEFEREVGRDRAIRIRNELLDLHRGE